jgi:hypothetical protein
MRTFYDFRTPDYANPHKHALQGYVLLKTKHLWLCWIYRDKQHVLGYNQTIKGFIVAPRTIYLYNVYLAKSFWDGVKYLFKIKK